MKKIRNILFALLVIAIGYYLISPKQHRLPKDYAIKETKADTDILPPVDNSNVDKLMVFYYAADDTACKTPIGVEFSELDKRKRFAEITALNALLTHSIPSEYKSAIIPGTQLNKFNVRDGVASIDMGPFMNLGSGNCTWEARKLQVLQTVNQFGTYKEVELTVEGTMIP